MLEAAMCVLMMHGLSGAQTPRGVDAALEAARDATFMTGENASEGARRFDESLTSAVARMPPEWRARARRQEGEGILARLASLAVDREERRELYEQVAEAYRFHEQRVVPRVASPLREHATESYRLVWEWILLRPVSRGEALPLDAAAAEALATIGNPASIVTLEHALDVARKGDGDRRRMIARQGQLLRALFAYPNPRGARTLLNATVAMAPEATVGSRPGTNVMSGQAIAEAMRRLPREVQVRWISVLSELEGLPADSEDIAAEVIAWLSVEKAFEMTQVTIASRRLSQVEASVARHELEEAANGYRNALDQAGVSMGQSSATRPAHDKVRARLFEIAKDRNGRRRVYDAISHYEVGRPIPVRQEEVDPSFTLAWEFLLLSPKPTELLPASLAQAANVLGRIGDPASIPALLHSFRVYAGVDTVLIPQARAAQESLLDAFAHMPSAAAANAVCEAVDLSERQPTPQHEFGQWHPAAHFVNAVSERGEPFRTRWRLVLADATKGARPCLEEVVQRLGSLLDEVEPN